MNREYDLFEKFPDGSLLWRDVVLGHEKAIHRLRELAAKTQNECYAMHLATNVILASMNDHQSSLQPKALNFSLDLLLQSGDSHLDPSDGKAGLAERK